jgi:hypothetical protein
MLGGHWTIGSFFIFLIYLIASVQSWRTGQGPNITLSRGEGVIWVIAAILLCAMAANIAFGGIDRLANSLRTGFRAESWYRDRMSVQLALILAALIVSSLVVLATLYWTCAMPVPSRLTGVALLALITFILVRTISLHALDEILYARISGVTLSTALEASAAAMILLLISWRRASATS